MRLHARSSAALVPALTLVFQLTLVSQLALVSLLTVVILLSSVAPAAAQSTTSTVAGTVADQTGQVLPGATVTLTDERIGVARTTATLDEGTFELNAVQPSTYTLRVELQGFRAWERQHIVLPPNERLAVGTIKLDVGGVSETVTTSAHGSYVQTQSSNRGALIDSTQLAQISQRGRNPMDIIKVLPGVSYTEQSDTAGSGGGSIIPNIGGNRYTWSSVAVDGLIGNDLGGPGYFSSTVSLDSIGEIQVELNNYRAEHGRNGAALVNIITKSGTKDFRGAAYWYGRHESLNANSFFNNANGQLKPEYRYSTVGGTLGGPVPWRKTRDKLFFFYSIEDARTSTPGGLQRVTVPTALERQGDFSQSLLDGRPVTIVDPRTGQPFANARIPADRLDPNGQALLNVLPEANRLDAGVTQGQYNYVTEESIDVPKRQHSARVDIKPTAQDSLYVRATYWSADNQGFAVPAGASSWGLVGAHYLYKDRGAVANWTRILRSNLVNELQVGGRYGSEDGSPLSDEGLRRVTRDATGFGLGQFTPSINPLGIIPNASFGGVPNPANITFNNRFPLTGADTILSFHDVLTWTRGRHTAKTGLYYEWTRNQEGASGDFSGTFNFGRNVNNPLDTGHPYANALLGNFQTYSESTSRPAPDGRAQILEWFAQDTWRPVPKLTLDYGLRFAYYTHYEDAGAAAAFASDRYDPASRPRLYQPVRIDGARRGLDPATGAVVPEVLIGALVPGSGDPANGMVLNSDESYPSGFREQEHVLVEPRLGVAYDPFGDGRTAIRGSFGVFHNMRQTGNYNWTSVGQPPLQFTPTVFYSGMDTLLQSQNFLFPSSAQGFQREVRTPRLYSVTAGVQREIGWGTVVDVAYVGTRSKYLLQSRSINTVPYGARFQPENQDPTQSGRPLSDNFFRPFPGLAGITIRENTGFGDYDALQVQANRRFTGGLQFGVAYTRARSRDTGSDDGDSLPLYQDVRAWSYARSSYDQAHVATINYTWDLPRASTLWNNALVRALLDRWQLSGVTVFATGSPFTVSFSTTDGADLTGGGDGTYVVRTGDANLPRGERGQLQWFRTDVFQRPARGEVVTGGRNVVRGPGYHNYDMTLFKNVALGGTRRLQLRWEIYNVFNHTQWAGIDNGARFDPAGQQVNPQFGQITSTRSPRQMQVSLRFSF